MFRILIKDLKVFISQKKIVFIVLIISLIATSYAFCFFIASSMHIAKILNEYKNLSTKYFVYDKNGIDNENVEILKEYLETNNLQGTVINLYSNIKKSDNNEFEIIIGSNNNKSSRVSFVGRTISEADIKSKSNYIMIEYLNQKAHKNPYILNNEISIDGEKYIVKAIDRIDITNNVITCNNINNYEEVNNITSYLIPITTFMDKFKTYSLDINISNNATQIEKNKFYTFLKNNFKNCNISSPIKSENINIEDIKENIILFTMLIVLALINIIALFTYWIKKNWRKYMIYRICGSSSIKIYMIIMLEVMIIALFSIIVGYLMYYISIPIFKSVYIEYVLKIEDVLLIQSIMLTIIFIITTFQALKISKQSPKYIERG